MKQIYVTNIIIPASMLGIFKMHEEGFSAMLHFLYKDNANGVESTCHPMVAIFLSWGKCLQVPIYSWHSFAAPEESPIPSTHSHHCTWGGPWGRIQGKGLLYFDYVYLIANLDCRLLQAQPGDCGLEERGAVGMSQIGCLLHCAQTLRSREMSYCRLISLLSFFRVMTRL